MRTRTRNRGRARATPYKRKAPAKKSLISRVNKITRFISQNKPEIKKAVFTIATPFNNNDCKTYNMMYQGLSQGVGEGQIIGKSFNLKSIVVKYRFTNESQAGATAGFAVNEQANLLSIIGHKEYYTLTNIPIAEINDTRYGSFNCWKPHYDTDKVKIYSWRKIHHRGTASGQTGTAPFLPDQNGAFARTYTGSMYKKMNRKITFERYSTDYKISGLNLYLLFQSNALGPNYSNFYGNFEADVTLYFTDD